MKIQTLLLAVLFIAACGRPSVIMADKTSHSFTTTSGVVLTIAKRVAPEYPAAARRARLHGAVKVQLTVQADGTISDLFVVKSADAVLDRLVLDAVAQWQFEPYTPKKGDLEKLQIPFTFALSK